MNISWIKLKSDNTSFKRLKNIGYDVFEIEDPDATDDKLKELINENYKTIIISNEVASLSGDLLTKYAHDKDIEIIIAPSHR